MSRSALWIGGVGFIGLVVTLLSAGPTGDAGSPARLRTGGDAGLTAGQDEVAERS